MSAIQIGLRQRFLLGQRFDSIEVGARRGQPRLLRLQLAARSLELRLERLGIELEQQLTGFDQLSLLVGDFVQEAGNARDE